MLFLYGRVLGVQLPWLAAVAVAQTPKRLPVVLTPTEVCRLLQQLGGVQGPVATLPDGTGMPLMKGIRRRVKYIEFARREIVVRDGNGG